MSTVSTALMPMPPYFWQEGAWQAFVDQIQQDKLSHAILITGIEALGADKLAVAMGQYLLCLSPMEAMACGKCRACKLLTAATHPDLMLVGLEEKASQIKVDQIRKVAGFVSQTAQQGGYKVVIVSPADSMNNNAANALLKNLEEPAGQTYLILVAENTSRILPTIRSRCAKMNLTPPARDLALAWLRENNIVEAEGLLTEASGSPLKVLKWKQADYLKDRRRLLNSLVELKGGAALPMTVAKLWFEIDTAILLHCLLTWVDKLIKIALGSLPETEKEFLGLLPLATPANAPILFRYRDRLCAKKTQIESNTNLNKSLLVEELLLDWHAVIKSVDRKMVAG